MSDSESNGGRPGALLEARVPGDKSISHRALLFAALADGVSHLKGLLVGEDCQSTASVLRSLGVDIPPLEVSSSTLGDGVTRVRGVSFSGLQTKTLGSSPPLLDCGNSGTTARLLLGILAGAGVGAVLTGDASLRSRPMRRVTGPLAEMGARFQEHGEPDRLPIEVRSSAGGLSDGRFRLPVASAQVKSALLLAGLLSGKRVEVIEPLRSRDHTERMLTAMGMDLEEGPAPGGGWRVVLPAFAGSLDPLVLDVPGDPSSAAFIAALAALGGAGEGVRIQHVGLNPTRIGAFRVLQRMGASVTLTPNTDSDGVRQGSEPVGEVTVVPASLKGTRIAGEEIPSLIDELPLLAIVAARAQGVTQIRDAGELRVKESDRIAVMAQNLRRVGIRVDEHPDGMDIFGSPGTRLLGTVSSEGDHRIAMAFGILRALPGNQIEVRNSEVAQVSYPGFWSHLESLGQGASARPTRPAAAAEPGDVIHPPIITLDGPAGSGKSTTARAVAARLGIPHLDSGALYRAVTLRLLEDGRAEELWPELTREELDTWDIRFVSATQGLEIRIHGLDPGDRLRGADVTAKVSAVAALSVVRDWLLSAQREAAQQGGIVADGRDMGTVVFPHAHLKVFMEADLEARARRRLLEVADGDEAGLEPSKVSEEAVRMGARDDADRQRTVAPLRPAPDALHLDTTTLSFEAQVERVVEWARRSHPALKPTQ